MMQEVSVSRVQAGRPRARGNACVYCGVPASNVVSRTNCRSVWLCHHHFEIWTELRKGPIRQAYDRMRWRLRR